MSWVAHDVEPYIIQAHLGKKISFLAVLIGSWSPDLLTKWIVYGDHIGPFGLPENIDPSDFHRSWPGIGPTHAPVFGIFLFLVVFLLTRNIPWSLGLMVGEWSHSFSDTLDTKGVMLFFPFTTERVSFDAWAYAAESGRGLDTAAYFSCLGAVWDGFWLAMTAVHWHVLRADYFRETVVPSDPVWGWAGNYVPEAALLVIYRAALFYGAGRWIAWLLWAHVLNTHDWDLSWGGPSWIKASQ